MDKTVQPLITLAIQKHFKHVVYRTMAILLLRRIDDVKQSIKKITPLITDDDFWMKCSEGKYKSHIMKCLRDVVGPMREDVAREVLKAYGLANIASESTYYHDVVSRMFDEGMAMMTNYIQAGRYDGIVAMSFLSESEK